ncbi:hypothetical protein V2J09_005995 [Rumex salicifolius]
MAFSAVFSSPCITPSRVSWASSPLPASIPPLPIKLSLGLRSPNSHTLTFSALRSPNSVYARATSDKSIHDFTVKDIDRKEISLSKFKGKLLLIVNVASQCGLTSSNYKELSQLYDKYKSKGFEILAFPCNQFGFQEPGSNQEIKNFACTRFKAEFPIFDKVDVNGPFTAPIYQFLKSSSGGFLGDIIKWNFEKFLVDKNGKVVERYPPTTSPLQIEKDIQKLLAA